MERLFSLGLANAAAATALAIAAAVVGPCLRRRPVLVHSLWLLVLVKLVTPPLFEIPLPLPAIRDGSVAEAREDRPPAVKLSVADPVVLTAVDPPGVYASGEVPIAAAMAVEIDSAPDAVMAAVSPTAWLEAAWVAGAVLILGLAAVRIGRFRRMLAAAEPASEELQEQVAALAAKLGVSRAPTAWHIDAPLTPMLWAVGCRPRLIIPTQLWKGLDARQRTLLLVHELAHLRRGDHQLRLFELVITAAFWWLPTVWWARSRLREAEEDCCDAWVVWAYPDDSRTYAETLLETVEFLDHSRSAVPLLASGFGRAHHLSLQRRLTMIMLGTTPRRLSTTAAIGAFGFAACLLPLTPSWAQKPVEKSETRSITIEVKSDDDKPADVAKAEVAVSVATDGEVEVVKADSVAKAVEALKKRVEALQKEDSEKSRAQIDALKQAISGLEKARINVSTSNKAEGQKHVVVESRVVEGKADGQKHIVLDGKVIDAKKDVIVLRSEPLSPENRARVMKARARIAAIQRDLARKQKELAEAQSDLAKLGGAESRIVVGERLPDIKPLGDKQIRIIERKLDARPSDLIEVQGRPLGRKEEDRIEALEKKLNKLLEEISGLRKQGKGDRSE